MEIKRTTEIVVEKTRRFVIRQRETDDTLLCSACGEPMLAAEICAVLFRVKCRLIYQLVEANAAHFTETETGAMFVCPQSIEAAIGNQADEPTAENVKLLSAAAEEIETKRKTI